MSETTCNCDCRCPLHKATSDLLEACQAMVLARANLREMYPNLPRTELDELLEAAIAKATGKQ